MATPRTFAATVALALPLALASCGKKKDEPTQPPASGGAAQPGDVPDGAVGGVVARTPVPAEQKINVTASLTALDDMMEAFKKLGESYTPDSPSDPMATLQSQLLGLGFAPGFLGNIDLAGTHVFATSFPAQGQGTPEDSSVAGSIAVTNGRKVIDSVPSAYRPAPLGEGMWELTQDDVRMLIKEAGAELQFGMTVEDLDQAAKLRGQVDTKGRRVKIRASNLPTDDLDPRMLLDLPDIQIVRDLTKVLQDLDAIELETDLGTTKDFELITSAKAPFSKLGLDPLGKPRTAPTAVEKVLPADPVFVTSLAYGDPKLLHKMIDASVPMSMIPDGFKDMVEKTLGGVHGLLDQVSNDVVFALYVDAKGRGSVVIAADVKDDAKTFESMRSLNEVALAGVEMQKGMVGKAKDQALDGSFKKAAVKLAGGAKGDLLSITFPKGMADELDSFRMFLSKDKLDMSTLVEDGIAVVTIGAGGRDVLAKVANGLVKAPKSSLASDAGLKSVRAAMGGCQVCMTGGPNEYLRFRLLLTKDSNPDQAKEATAKLKELAKTGDLGLMGAGVKVEKDSASLGLVVPQTFLYADKSKAAKFMEINDFVNGGDTGMSMTLE